MTEKQREIIKEWKNVKIVHPSYGEIAKKIGVAKSYVFKTVSEYLNNKETAKRGK